MAYDSDSDVYEILIFAYFHTHRRTLRQRRAIWIHDTIRKRRQLGEYHRLVSELRRDSLFSLQNVLSYVTYCIRSTTSTSETHHSEDEHPLQEVH